MLDEIHVSTKIGRIEERKQARNRLFRAMREGYVPGTDDFAKARGMVIRQRENSIFSDAWIPLAIIICIIGVVANRNAAVLATGIGLFVIVGLSTWWKRGALLGVTYERSFDRSHVFPGEPLTMTLTINNRKPLPLTWLQFRDQTPVAPQELGELAAIAGEVTGRYILQNTLSVNSFEQTQRTATFRFPRRGFYNIGPVSYRSGDIFTLFTIEREHRYLDTLVVYPKVWPLETLELPAKEMFGEFRVRRSLFTDPIRAQGIRDYQPQDRFRDVHWKATARRGNLQTKVYDPTSGMTIVVFLNVATYPKHWMGFDRDLLERAVSVSASIASHAAEQRWGVGAFANGTVPGSDQPIRVSPGHAPHQLMRILEALAAVTEFATGSIELLMHNESRRLPWAATFVLVTAIVTEEMLIGLMRLKEAGRSVTLISLANDPLPTELHGLLAYHIPSSAPPWPSSTSAATPTEAALNAIPIPEPVQSQLEKLESSDE